MILSISKHDLFCDQDIKSYFDLGTVNNLNFDGLHKIKLYKNNNEIGFLDFVYYLSGFIKIINFKVTNHGIGHGRLLMETFYKTLPLFQQKLIDMGYIKRISYITGDIVSDGTTSHNELLEIYIKLGFSIENGKLKMEYEDLHNVKRKYN